MIENKRVLALVPARSGSKGLPNKNILKLCGKPLLAWSIEAALASVYVDEVIVSTDSEEIASIAREYGASTPFIRPSYLASDDAGSIDVILHAIDFLEQRENPYHYLVLLEPTSPIRNKCDIDRSLEMVQKNKGATAIVSLTKVETTHPAFLMREGVDNFLHGYENTGIKRRQELSELYHVDGTIYVSEIESLRKKMTFYHEKTIAIKLEKWKSFEIDDDVDFCVVETLMKRYGGM